LQALKASEHEAGADKYDEREADLGHDERGAEAITAMGLAASGGAFLEVVVEVGS
jgi:hypothetical protein